MFGGKGIRLRYARFLLVGQSVIAGAFGEFLVVPTATLLECAVVWTRNAPFSVFKVRRFYTVFLRDLSISAY